MVWQGEALVYARAKYPRLDILCDAFASDLYDLDMVGLHEIAQIIITIGMNSPSYAHKLAFDYCNLLARPMFECLGGVVTYNKRDRILANQLYMETEGLPLATKMGATSEGIHNIENILGAHPSELIEFFPQELAVPDFSRVADIGKFVEKIDQDTDVSEFRRMLFQITTQNSTPTDLLEVGNAILEKINRDANVYGIASSVFKHALYIGGSVAALSNFDQSTQRQALMGLIGAAGFSSATDKIHKASEIVFSKLAGTILRQPILSNFHQGKRSKS